MSRSGIGSWLQGPRAAAEQAGVDLGYPGERLGLPRAGPGSVARLGRRLTAICVDWALCLLVSHGLFDGRPSTTLAIFAVENLLLVGTIGTTVGMRLCGVRVQAVGHGVAGPLRAVIRTVLLCLAVPALIWDRDQRGLHDKAAGTVLLRTG